MNQDNLIVKRREYRYLAYEMFDLSKRLRYYINEYKRAERVVYACEQHNVLRGSLCHELYKSIMTDYGAIVEGHAPILVQLYNRLTSIPVEYQSVFVIVTYEALSGPSFPVVLEVVENHTSQ